MRYASNRELPRSVREVLPRHAQDIYRAAFNAAYERYGAAHEVAVHRLAWAAVKRHYVHVGGPVWVPRHHDRGW